MPAADGPPAALDAAVDARTDAGSADGSLADATPPDAAAPDAAPVDASPPDAAPPDATPPLGPFGPPAIIAALMGPDLDDDPTLTADLLELYLNSNRAGGLGQGDIWRSTRATVTDPWGPPINVTELNSAVQETTPELSADGLTIYFSSNRPTAGAPGDVWMSTRPSRDLPWSAPVPVVELATTSDERSPTPTVDGLTLYFSSDRPGGAGGHDLYVTTRATLVSPWDPPTRIVELASTGYDSEPAPWGADELFFASNRGGLGTDLYDANGGVPVAIPELNSPADDDDPWVSPDGRVVVFTSSRDGNADIYEAFR